MPRLALFPELPAQKTSLPLMDTAFGSLPGAVVRGVVLRGVVLGGVLAGQVALPAAQAQVPSAAGKSEALPTQLPAMTTLSDTDVEPYKSEAEGHGFNCMIMQAYSYQNAALATQSVNEWLQGHNMQTETVSNEPGMIQWKAWNDTSMPIYAVWKSAETGGTLWMCSGTDTVAMRRAEAQQAQAEQAATTRANVDNSTANQEMLDAATPEYRTVRIPIGLMFVVGMALIGGITQLFNRFKRPSPQARQSAAQAEAQAAARAAAYARRPHPEQAGQPFGDVAPSESAAESQGTAPVPGRSGRP